MVNITDPYNIRYPRIVAVADEGGERVELVEFFDCVGGAMWSKHHYVQSPPRDLRPHGGCLGTVFPATRPGRPGTPGIEVPGRDLRGFP